MTDTISNEELLKLATEARDHSYSPYSHYSVGAALLTKDGRVYQGCNIENASFTPTICAERTAFFKAIYDGVHEFSAIAIIGSGELPAFPCGVCRQVSLIHPEALHSQALRLNAKNGQKEYEKRYKSLHLMLKFSF